MLKKLTLLRCKTKNKPGFSLIEMMIVMLMMSIILAMATPIITRRAKSNNTVSTATAAVPMGSVIYFASTTPPDGFLECNGSIPTGSKYDKLKAFLNTTYGAYGQLPDLRGEFIRGWDHSRGVDSGRTFGTLQSDSTKVYLDGYSGYDTDGKSDRKIGLTAWDGNDNRYEAMRVQSNATKGASNLQTAMHSVYGGASETRGRNVSLLPCIKY